MAQFLANKYEVPMREDLTEAKVYGIWTAILEVELKYISDKFAEADI